MFEAQPEGPPVLAPQDLPGTIRPALVAVAAGLIAAALTASPASAAHPWSPVRHPGRQQTVSPVREQRPIHYPRAARSLPAQASEAGPHTANPADRLLGEFFDLHTAMAYEQAAVVAARLVEISQEAARAHYNQACVMGRLRRTDEALSSLEQAVNHGWRNLVHLSIDPDLDSLRATARYRALVQRLKDLILDEHPALPARSGAPTATMVIVGNGAVPWSGSFRRPATTAGYLQLIEHSPGGVALLRWSAQRRHGVVVVTAGGDRGSIAGRIAGLDPAGHVGNPGPESQ